MSEWWTYRLSDLLMFSPRVYYRLIEAYNGVLWPVQLVILLLSLAALAAVLRPTEGRTRLLFVGLGLAWIWTGWGFLWERFAGINWMMSYVAPAFWLQGLALIGLGATGRAPVITVKGAASFAAFALLAAALLLFPFVAPLAGRSWSSVEIFGLMPDPTALATLAILALADGRSRWLIIIVPLLWCAISAATLSTMGSAEYLLPLSGAILAFGLALARRTVR